MNNMRTWLNLLESLQDWNDGRWVHYSDTEMLTINPKPFHQDPLGIYCFPEKFVPHTNMWLNKKYKFLITLKPGAQILDFSTASEKEIDDLLEATDALEHYQAYAKQYPIKNKADMLKKAWESMRNSMILKSGSGGRAKWNNVFRSLGWDAIFDDTGSIHSVEVQLLILDPRVIAHVEKKILGTSGYEEVKKVVADVVELCKSYGQISIEEPKKVSDGWRPQKGDPKILKATVRVEKSDENYAEFEIRYDDRDEHRKGKIGVSLRWSRPSLGYGAGASYDIHRREYDRFSNLERLKPDLDIIFGRNVSAE